MRLLFTALFLLMLVALMAAAQPSPPGAGNEIKGDVLYWEGEELVVKEMSGKEARLRVTGDTKIQGASGRLKTGDKIVAQISPDGQAQSITLQIPDGGSSPPAVR